MSTHEHQPSQPQQPGQPPWQAQRGYPPAPPLEWQVQRHPQQPPPSAYQRPPAPPPAPWQRRQRTGTWLIVLGLLSVAAGLVIEYGWYNKPVSQINGLCSSGLGQLAQAGSSRAASNCSQAALLDHLLGWLIIAGVLAVAAGVATGISARNLRATAAPAAPASPFPPPPQG